jgi:hypothetical protein
MLSPFPMKSQLLVSMSLADWKPCVALCLDYQSVIPKPDAAYECCWDCGLLASDPRFPTCLKHFDQLRRKRATKEAFGPRRTISTGIIALVGCFLLVIIFLILRR